MEVDRPKFCAFSRLPLELRRQIYTFFFPPIKATTVRSPAISKINSMFQLRKHMIISFENPFQHENDKTLYWSKIPLLFVSNAIGDEVLQYLVEKSTAGLYISATGIAPSLGEAPRLSLLQLPVFLGWLDIKHLRLNLKGEEAGKPHDSDDLNKHWDFSTLSELCPNLQYLKVTIYPEVEGQISQSSEALDGTILPSLFSSFGFDHTKKLSNLNDFQLQVDVIVRNALSVYCSQEAKKKCEERSKERLQGLIDQHVFGHTLIFSNVILGEEERRFQKEGNGLTEVDST